jgi:predicted enzyme related to lactoylglutathione lyase
MTVAEKIEFQQIVFPVKEKDLAREKALFRKLLGVEPYADGSFYVGFRIDGREIGLDPNAGKQGITGPVGYFIVEDIRRTLKELTDAGATIHSDARDVGYGMLVALVKDPDGNIFGLKQNPK